MRRRSALLLVVLALSCKSGLKQDCAILFGSPTADTGLTADQCRPLCACNGTVFQPPAYDDAFIQSLVDDWLPESAPPLDVDPYSEPVPADDPPGTVCAVLPGDAAAHPRPYSLATFPSTDAALAAGAHPTHFGHCGVCSTLANLAVYMRYVDLGKPVRSCGFAASDGGIDGDLQCLQGLGFDLPCAQIWAYNTQHTRSVCLDVCLDHFADYYNNPDDGTLNPCLQCDEDQSGPVFKAVAGRTRRNSGLPNAICRPCSEVQPLVHSY